MARGEMLSSSSCSSARRRADGWSRTRGAGLRAGASRYLMRRFARRAVTTRLPSSTATSSASRSQPITGCTAEPNADIAAVTTRARTIPIASWLSSMTRPTMFSHTHASALDILRRHVRAERQQPAEQPHREDARHEEHGEDREERERVTGPVHAEALREPEDAERREDRADTELQDVLRDHRERVAQRGSEGDDDDACRDRAQDR